MDEEAKRIYQEKLKPALDEMTAHQKTLKLGYKMTKREIVLEQVDFIRKNTCLVIRETIEKDFWLKMNEIFADDLKYSRVELWTTEDAAHEDLDRKKISFE